MLRQIWYEIAYWWDICRVTRGSHIEQLWLKLDTILYHWIPLVVEFLVLELLKFLSE
jgi:hypothetical protein